MISSTFKVLGAAAVLGLASLSANSAEVDCPDQSQGVTTRIFFVDSTPDASCWDYGEGNINDGGGNSNVVITPTQPTLAAGTLGDAFLQVPTAILTKADSGNSWTTPFLKITFDPGVSNSGKFEVLGSFDNDWILLLKSGNADNPDWAAFLIDGSVTEGEWRTTPSESGGLSHASIYAAPGDFNSEVPLPAAAWLLLSGMVGLFGISRRRTA